jgi:hypothetical protein
MKSLLAAILGLVLVSNASAQSDFSTFWQKFKSAVVHGDKSAVGEMTKLPLSMPAFQKKVKDKTDFLRPLRSNL